MKTLEERGDDFECHAQMTEKSPDLFQPFVVELGVGTVLKHVGQFLNLLFSFDPFFL
jgi:hypothetical protein